jgi:hypothetical protein
MKKGVLILIIVLVVVAVILLRSFNGGEDNWIKDSRGVYIKHGNPSQTPNYVVEQQKVITDALALYNQKKAEQMNFSSQCLGTIDSYVVDIVHVPRNSEDNLAENQCEDYKSGLISHFIELNKDGNIIRIV